ncbi:MAG TPA: hypothetical protein PLN43_00300 [Anaerolineales bacterium]|nr:hypothetical protein [Anaerolineales bacterium]HMZ06215.1 hypothetical protein [Anaerolineales bacterium]HNA88848.1 hypothetical protein [Anaerolineales bacterium]HNB34638.1 hypothetical protein [Anaerolineales bacterium]HNC07299.1 hypothetical protein [Anaerolineales bacterium]
MSVPGDMAEKQSEKMKKMMAMLSQTRDVELTCDEVFAMLDEFTELAAQGEDVRQLMPLVQQHLDTCPDCRDEYKVLESIVLAGV